MNKKVAPRCVDVQEKKKIREKVTFLAFGDFFYLGHKTLNVFEQLHINDGTLFLNTLSYNIIYGIYLWYIYQQDVLLCFECNI